MAKAPCGGGVAAGHNISKVERSSQAAASLCWFESNLLVSLLCLSVQPTDSQVQQDSSTAAAAAGGGGPSSGAGSSRAAAAAAARRAGHTRTTSLELGRGGPGQLAAAGSPAGDLGGLSMATLVLQVLCVVNCSPRSCRHGWQPPCSMQPSMQRMNAAQAQSVGVAVVHGCVRHATQQLTYLTSIETGKRCAAPD
jgi:hypothetical protein